MPNAQQDSKHLNNNDITTNNVCCTGLNKADQNKQTVTWQQVRCKQRMGTLLIWGQKSGAVHFVESYCGWMVYFVESTSIIIIITKTFKRWMAKEQHQTDEVEPLCWLEVCFVARRDPLDVVTECFPFINGRSHFDRSIPPLVTTLLAMKDEIYALN